MKSDSNKINQFRKNMNIPARKAELDDNARKGLRLWGKCRDKNQ